MSEHNAPANNAVEMPAPTAWPLVLGVGITLVALALAMNIGFLIAALPVFLFGIGGWIGQLLPGRGHEREPLAAPGEGPTPPIPRPGTVESLHPGVPGYRFRLPQHVHPLSSGIRGGFVGALLMPIPAMIYGVLHQQSPWFPINLLAGMVLPGLSDASAESLRQFSMPALVLGSFIHLSFSVTFGLMYGVILPMLPQFRGSPLFFGGVLMPILWSGVCYGLMGVVNPAMEEYVNWPWFIASQFVFGLAMSYVVYRSEKVAVSQAPPLKNMGRPKS